MRTSLALGSRGSGKLPEKWKPPEVVRGGCEKCIGPEEGARGVLDTGSKGLSRLGVL